MNVEQRMTKIRTRLLLDQPWFGSLSMRLKLKPDETKRTLATDGTTIFYNPAYVATLPDAEVMAIMAEEVMHCALLHPYRRGARDPEKWNQACDFAIWSELKAAGLEVPKDALIDDQYQGLSAETIYAKRGQKPKSDPGQDAGQQSPGTGDVMDAPQPSQQLGQEPAQQPGQGMTAEDWKIAAEQATAVSKAAGSVPGGAVRATKKARESAEDWRATLREFVEHQVPSDFTWGSPNRRHIAEGLYLPGVLRENLGYIAVGCDVSGSISQRFYDCVGAELTALLHELRPEKLSVAYCDYTLQGTEEFSPDDTEVKLTARGGGGTRFSPVLDYFNGQDEKPSCLIYFTDLECSERLTETEYPVLWCTDLSSVRTAQFGRTVRIDLETP